jgi:hypothetical protein
VIAGRKQQQRKQCNDESYIHLQPDDA